MQHRPPAAGSPHQIDLAVARQIRPERFDRALVKAQRQGRPPPLVETQHRTGGWAGGLALATLCMAGQISVDAAMSASSLKEELTEMLNRGTGVVAGAGLGRGPMPPVRRT